MEYITVAETAKKWGISERSVRNYATNGRIEGAKLDGKTWMIPVSAKKPERLNKKNIHKRTLLDILKEEKELKTKGGIYHKIQIELTYNSNRIEGSKLTHEQTRYIFETNTIGMDIEPLNVDDIVETANHFNAINIIIEQAKQPVSESLIKLLHQTLKNGTSDSRKEWFAVGGYKKLPNEVGGKETALPEEVPMKMKQLLSDYNKNKSKSFIEIIDFHYQFESIHPFQDGNGRVGRLIMFKELLRNNIVPFVIDDDMKMYYYRGLSKWEEEKGYLLDTCYASQDKFKKYLDYFRIPYDG
ncbi:Fic family protein [Bacillus ndiopicus]|uniref:Fic family protein n=1 Tax=Bacillus ndiopicus TaxID=1347368 RepID=UPI0005A835E1|nr:DNA-binding protein [Bacillus ndiopicus]